MSRCAWHEWHGNSPGYLPHGSSHLIEVVMDLCVDAKQGIRKRDNVLSGSRDANVLWVIGIRAFAFSISRSRHLFSSLAVV